MILEDFLVRAGTEKNLMELILFLAKTGSAGEERIFLFDQENPGR